MAYGEIRKLGASDLVGGFDCGQPPLNQFLHRFALVNQKANGALTFFCCQYGAAVAYYSLAVGSVDSQDAQPRVLKGMACRPVPAMILARLAVDRHHPECGLGEATPKDALLRTAQAAEIAD